MKTALKHLLVLSLGLLPSAPLWAGQQVYLSESPNGKYRVLVEQSIERRVGDRIFFRYPIRLVNTKNPRRHFEIRDAAPPLIQETERGTFQVRWDGADNREPSSIHFLWSPDSLRFFMRLEVLKGDWRTFFVDVNTGVTTDITADLEKELLSKIASKGWDCQRPSFEVVRWTKPHLAFLRVSSACGKKKGISNEKLFPLADSILFEARQVAVVSHCLDCEAAKAEKKFEKYFRTTIPTPTPTPEETPVAQ
jgi:hypothetical protein